jgi:hypothetical protein
VCVCVCVCVNNKNVEVFATGVAVWRPAIGFRIKRNVSATGT